MRYFILVSALAVFFVATCKAESVVFSGDAGVDYRYFVSSPLYSSQVDGQLPEWVFEPELMLRSGDNTLYRYKGFYRFGSDEGWRDHWDIRELYWLYMGDQIDFTVGIVKVFWGVTESRHLVDVINQSDMYENIDEEQKLGQPAISVSVTKNWGTLSLYWLPYFRARDFSGTKGRFRTDPVVDESLTVFVNGRHNNHRDGAFRYSTSIDDFDLGISLFRGYERRPWLLPMGDPDILVANYTEMTQLGVDLQYTRDAWLWKFEGVANKNDWENYTSLVAGTEYTLYQLLDSAADLGLLVEYLHSNKNQYVTDLFDNDVFLGGRLALNNTQDSSLIVGVIIDLEEHESLFRLESETRLGRNWTVELNALFFDHAVKTLASYEKDSYLEAKLRLHF